MFLFLEEAEGKLGTVLQDLIDEVFEGLHPEVVDRGNKVNSRAFHFLTIVYHIFSAILKFMEKLGLVQHH